MSESRHANLGTDSGTDFSSDPSADLARSAVAAPKDTEPESKGPNLVLYYSLIALALVTAIACAIMIVLPFYKTRH